MDDGEIIRSVVSASEHPADMDQQVAELRDLLPKAKAFIACLLVPSEEWTEESQQGYTHVMIATVPNVPLLKFLSVVEDIVEAANDLLSDGRVHDGGDSTEG